MAPLMGRIRRKKRVQIRPAGKIKGILRNFFSLALCSNASTREENRKTSFFLLFFSLPWCQTNFITFVAGAKGTSRQAFQHDGTDKDPLFFQPETEKNLL